MSGCRARSRREWRLRRSSRPEHRQGLRGVGGGAPGRFLRIPFPWGAPLGAPPGRQTGVVACLPPHPALADYSTFRIFFTCSPEIQLLRLEQRESPESLKKFKERWIPMEENYFGPLSIEARSDIVVDTSRLPTLEEELI